MEAYSWGSSEWEPCHSGMLLSSFMLKFESVPSLSSASQHCSEQGCRAGLGVHAEPDCRGTGLAMRMQDRLVQGRRTGCRATGICKSLGLLTNTWTVPVLSLLMLLWTLLNNFGGHVLSYLLSRQMTRVELLIRMYHFVQQLCSGTQDLTQRS